MILSPEDTRRYLALLDVPAGAPTRGLLTAIVRAHLWRVELHPGGLKK
jgi:hypothetical protein